MGYNHTQFVEMPGEVLVTEVQPGDSMSPVGSRIEGIQTIDELTSILALQAMHMLRACVPNIAPDGLSLSLRHMDRVTDNERQLFRTLSGPLTPSDLSLQTLFPYIPSNGWAPRLEEANLHPYRPVRMSLGAYREFYQADMETVASALWSRIDIWLNYDAQQVGSSALKAHKSVVPVREVTSDKLHDLLYSRRRSMENARLIGSLTLAG